MPVLFCFSGEGKWSFFAGNIYTERFLYYNTVAKKNFDEKAGEGICPREDMKRGLNICCGVLALALLFGGCAQSVPQQEQEPKAEPVAAGAFAA